MRNAEEELADFNTPMTAARLDVAGNTYQDTGVDVHKEAIDLVARADALEKGLEKLYPEPKKLLAELQEQAAKVIPIMERVKSRKVMLEGAARIPVSVMKQMARVLPAAIQFLESMASQRTSSQAADSQSSGSHGTGPQLPASAEAHEQREIIRDLRKELASVRSQIVHTQRERDDAEISSQSDIKRNAEVQLEMQEKIDSLRIRIRTLDSENEAKDAIISKLQAQLVAAESDAASNDPAVQKKDSA
ncbi:hypothetical protein NKR23_g11980 [Pleurostoma richardsiae]|uniref:Uncharacterized protein n=1 Tax=Pleurostoma richardsiae TaxID=41990 RepID=A0AA38VB52_9PEZI|nr:hypothetical protein NKR23_g11980 [Pleurostoma richardsiae]